MSLSDQSKPNLQTSSTWQKFEIKSFGADWVAEGNGRKEFYALQVENATDAAFIPMELNQPQGERMRTPKDVLEAVQAKTDLIEQEAYENGFSQGEKAGFEIGEKKALKVIGNMESLLLEMADMKLNLLKHHEQDIMGCVLAIAGAIVKIRAEKDDQVIRDAIFAALDLAVDRTEIKMKVNPEDYDIIENLRPDLFSGFKNLKSMIVIADASVSRGGCIMETPKGDIDASIEGRMDKIKHCLMAALNENFDE